MMILVKNVINSEKYKYLFIQISVIALIVPFDVVSQSLYFDRIGINQGLSQNSVFSTVQDNKGFMWFGTQSGINRFDGYKFKTYNHTGNDDNANGNGVGDATVLLIDRENKIWIGGYNGISVLDNVSGGSNNYKHSAGNILSLSNNQIWAMLEDQSGAIWIGTGHGLNRFNRKTQTFTRFFHDSSNKYSLSHNVVNTLFQDDAGNLWVGTDRGLNRFDYQRQRFDHIGEEWPVLFDGIITAIAEDGEGRLWIGTDGQGLIILDKTRQKHLHKTYNSEQADSISANKIKSLLKDRYDRMWIGTDNRGLNIWDKTSDRFIRYKHNPSDPHSLSDNDIISLYEDKSGVIWIGTFTKGVSKFNPYGFSSTINVEYPGLDNSDPHTDIRAFLIDKKGLLWVASSSNGIRVTLPTGNKISYRHNPNDHASISSDKVYSLHEDRNGNVWVGTANGGLNKYDRRKDSFKRFELKSDKFKNYRPGKILTMDEDSMGLIWIGTERAGAFSFNSSTGVFTHYNHNLNNSNSISSGRVFDLHVDRFDGVWFATFGGGLSHYNKSKNKFTSYNGLENKKYPINTGVLHEDKHRNVLWVGTYGGGVYKFDLLSEEFINIGKKDGLPDMMIYGILQDKHGYLWISHNKGISRFNIDTKTFHNYDELDGLQSNEFNGGAYYQSSNGKFFFGGINGYNAFYPNEILDNPYKPPVYITEFQLFNSTIESFKKYDERVILPNLISDMDNLSLSYKDYVFSLEFAGLDYANSSKNQYAYKMEGLEDDWNYVSSQRRFVTYTTLPPGDYIFRVKGSNNNNIWNHEGASLGISVAPPLWQTWWFRVLLGLMIVTLAYTVHRLRIKAIHDRNELLREQVKERTSDLEETLSELVQTKDAFEESSKVATGALHNVGNLLNSVNTSIAVIQKMIYESVIKKLVKANKVLRENIDNIEEFVSKRGKGKKLIEYCLGIEKSILEEQDELNKNVIRSIEKISAIKEVISTQQRSAKGQGFVEKLSLISLIDETIILQSGVPDEHEIRFDKCYGEVPDIKVEKAKLVQVLLNLYKNAKESMDEINSENKVVTIELSRDEENAYIKVSDNGLGIAADKLKDMFSYGFTTKISGHGFGLYSCANYMEGMGGSISAVSDGLGKGATFILQLPLHGVSMDRDSKQKVQLKVVGGYK